MFILFFMLFAAPLTAQNRVVNRPVYVVPNPYYQEALTLRAQNEELKRSLESFDAATKELQQRLVACENKFKEAQASNLVLQQNLEKMARASQFQTEQDTLIIEELKNQQDMMRSEMRRQAQQYEVRLKAYASRIQQGEQKSEQCERLIKQTMQENQRLEKLRSQEAGEKYKLQESIEGRNIKETRAERLAQFYRQKADELQQQNQQQQATLAACEKQLKLAQQDRGQLQQSQQSQKVTSSDELDLLNRQIISLKRSLDNSRTDLDACHRQMKEQSDSSQQKIDQQTKRIETYERTARSSSTDKEECEKQMAEKTAAIDKWRQSNGDLQTQLNAAITINNQLRIQLTALQAECEALKRR